MSDVERTREQIAKDIIAEIIAEEIEWRRTICVGDYIDAREDGTYMSTGERYRTKDKLYRIYRVDRRDTSTTAVADSDIPGEDVYFSSSRVIVRDGKVIWGNSVYKYVMGYPGRDWSEYPTLAECIFDLDAAMKEAGLCE